MNAKKIALGIIGASIRIIIIAFIVISIYRLSSTAYDFGFRVFAEKPISTGEGRDVEVTIPLGKSTMEIGKILEEKGLIRDAKLFYLQELLSSYRGDLQPGFYTLNTSMSATEMMAVMAETKDENEKGDSE